MDPLRFSPQSTRKVDAQLRTLLGYLGLAEPKIVLLKYSRPSRFEPEVQNCHLNVWCQLREAGGTAQHGWVLAQDKAKSFAEAIFHTVWCAPDGKLFDVTPRVDLEKRLMFAPDPARGITLTTHDGLPAIHTFDNVRMLGTRFLNPIEEITISMQSDFAQRHGLWPW